MCTVLMKFVLYDCIDKAFVVDRLMGEKNNYCLTCNFEPEGNCSLIKLLGPD